MEVNFTPSKRPIMYLIIGLTALLAVGLTILALLLIFVPARSSRPSVAAATTQATRTAASVAQATAPSAPTSLSPTPLAVLAATPTAPAAAIPTVTPLAPVSTVAPVARAYPPGVYVAGIALRPAGAKKGQNFGFEVTFSNTKGAPQSLSWGVRWGTMVNPRVGITNKRAAEIPPGSFSLPTADNSVVKGKNCEEFFAVALFFDAEGEHLFPDAADGRNYLAFRLCP